LELEYGMTGYIHIGAPKCGSTGLQSLIAANIAALQEAGVRAPQSQALANELAHRFAYGWQKKDDLKQALAEEGEGFELSGGDILLSSESYLAAASEEGNLDRLIDLFEQDELQVLAVIRDPASLLESTWFQWMRTHRTFPKVHDMMRTKGLYYKAYLDSSWFSEMNQNWQRWQQHPKVTRFSAIRLGLDAFDSAEVLADFLQRPLPPLGPGKDANESMNGVTFRLLKEWRGVPLPRYGSFVAQVERMTKKQRFGSYRFLTTENAALVNQSAADLPLFSDFYGQQPPRKAAQDLPKDVFADLLEETRKIAAWLETKSA